MELLESKNDRIICKKSKKKNESSFDCNTNILLFQMLVAEVVVFIRPLAQVTVLVQLLFQLLLFILGANKLFASTETYSRI